MIFVFTHDAMGDGEDGPTHQPIEHLISLRAVPGLTVLRPGDANEVIEAYRCTLKMRHRPSVLALSRQPLPILDRGRYRAASGVSSGAIEQGSTLGWERYIGQKGRVIGMHTFGASAPLKALQGKFGFDPASILRVAREVLASR